MRSVAASAPCGCRAIHIARCAALIRRSPISSTIHRTMPGRSLAILLESGRHDRAHYAFVLASGAAALGRSVVLFATNRGCHALMTDWSGLEDAARDARLRSVGVAGLDELREATQELGVTLIVCEAGMRAEGF